jgi:hypothetical protein
MQPLRSRQPGRHRPSVHRPDSGDIELWRALGVNRGVLGMSAEVMAQCRGGDQVCDLVDLFPIWPVWVIEDVRPKGQGCASALGHGRSRICVR